MVGFVELNLYVLLACVYMPQCAAILKRKRRAFAAVCCRYVLLRGNTDRELNRTEATFQRQ